ncbi:MAG: DUF3231 family protein [Bacillota bacterium]
MTNSIYQNNKPDLNTGYKPTPEPGKYESSLMLNSAEVGNLWSQYLWDSMAVCFLQHFAENVEDPDIQSAIEYALKVSQKHTVKIRDIFTAENIPVPVGFTHEDFHQKAPRLFSDSVYLHYLSYMGKNGMMLYAQIMSMCTRSDIRDFYSMCLDSSRELDNKTLEILQSKGLYIRPPFMAEGAEVDFVEKKSFLGSFWGSDRPLHALEASHMFYNIQRNVLGKTILSGLVQVTQSDIIRDYFMKGIEIAHKHIEIFSSLLEKSNLPATTDWEIEITDSTTPPLSDKIMLYHTTFLIPVSTSFYSAAIGVSNRKDLTASYARLIAEVLKYAGEGINIMIDNGWMEEPPQAGGRYNLTVH